MTVFRTTALLLAAAFAAGLSAQTTPPTAAPTTTPAAAAEPQPGTPTYIWPETPQQRLARVGTTEDPGPDPDPNKHFARFGYTATIERFPRASAVYGQCNEPNYVRPDGRVNVCKEIYQQDKDYVWVWVVDPPAAPAPGATAQTQPPAPRYSDLAVQYYSKLRSEFFEVTPPPAGKTIRFEESSEGLPTIGSFRNSLAVADMNGDGKVDLIVPPERGVGDKNLTIYLGDGQGHWKSWEALKWPHPLDYGSVAVADLNKDGHQDVVLGVHLNGVYVFLGDGKGGFTEVSEGLPHDFPTRRAVITDADGDGYPDIVAISEGPTALQQSSDVPYGKLRVFYNRRAGRSWVGSDIAGVGAPVGGDFLTAADFNGDRRPDFAAASIYFGAVQTLWLSSGAKTWKYLEDRNVEVVPAASYYYASAAGKFSGSKNPELIQSFVRFWPNDLDPALVPPPPMKNVAGIDRLTFGKDGVKRQPIMRWDTSTTIWGLGTGDFDRDGNQDVAFTRFDPRDMVILLGDGRGGFTEAAVEGLKLPVNANYDLKVADVNGDGRPDVILMFETVEKATPFEKPSGSVRVYLNRGVAKSEAASTTPGSTSKH